MEGSPASKSALKKGDCIKKIGSVEVVDRGDLAHAAFFAKPGTVVPFVVRRDDKTVSVPIKVEKRAVLLREEESKIAEVDGAVPGGDSLRSASSASP